MNADQISQLSDEEKRVKIAEACGWGRNTHGAFEYRGDWRTARSASQLPNYLTSLDTMAEVERTLDPHPMVGEVANYRNWLTTLCGSVEDAISASAAQRATAFLLTINKQTQ